MCMKMEFLTPVHMEEHRVLHSAASMPDRLSWQQAGHSGRISRSAAARAERQLLPGAAGHPGRLEVLPGELEAAEGVAAAVQHAHHGHRLPVHAQREAHVAHAQPCRHQGRPTASVHQCSPGLMHCSNWNGCLGAHCTCRNTQELQGNTLASSWHAKAARALRPKLGATPTNIAWRRVRPSNPILPRKSAR